MAAAYFVKYAARRSERMAVGTCGMGASSLWALYLSFAWSMGRLVRALCDCPHAG